MTLQNRVDPYGQLQAVAARGHWMGNRGVLHDTEKRIVAFSRSPRWITCALDYKGIRREVFSPNRYSELFFLDEATSLAAGHRPCAECRRKRYEAFLAAWAAGNGGPEAPHAGDIDRTLQAERVQRGGVKRTFEAELSSLPDGTLLDLGGHPYLYWGGGLRPWSFAGYGTAENRVPSEINVKVLTPKSIVRAIRAGFLPQVHESAGRKVSGKEASC